MPQSRQKGSWQRGDGVLPVVLKTDEDHRNYKPEGRHGQNNDLRGITGLLDEILSPARQTAADSGPGPGNPSENGPSPVHLHDQPDSSLSLPVSRVVARRGRPPGKATAAVLREKVTVRIATELIATYRDWSWQARSQLSHLVEQALKDYRERNH